MPTDIGSSGPSDSAQSSREAAAPAGFRPIYAWWTVGVLMVLQTLSLLDRHILSLMIIEVRADLGLDETSLAAALLHDAVEDTEITLSDVEQSFGPEVAQIVDGVTKLERLQFDSKEAQQAATMRKMLVAMARDLRVLIIKPKIGAWGLNWQHCNHVVSFASHSYEQMYQSVRRCYRFGQTRPVTFDLVATEGEELVIGNVKRKADQAEKMFEKLVEEMARAVRVERENIYTKKAEVPSWLTIK